MPSTLSRRAEVGVSQFDARRTHPLLARIPLQPDPNARDRRVSPDQAAAYANPAKARIFSGRSSVTPKPMRGRRRLVIDGAIGVWIDLTRPPRPRRTTAICALRTAGVGRVEVWRGDVRLSMFVSAPFVWRCLSGSLRFYTPLIGRVWDWRAGLGRSLYLVFGSPWVRLRSRRIWQASNYG